MFVGSVDLLQVAVAIAEEVVADVVGCTDHIDYIDCIVVVGRGCIEVVDSWGWQGGDLVQVVVVVVVETAKEDVVVDFVGRRVVVVVLLVEVVVVVGFVVEMEGEMGHEVEVALAAVVAAVVVGVAGIVFVEEVVHPNMRVVVLVEVDIVLEKMIAVEVLLEVVGEAWVVLLGFWGFQKGDVVAVVGVVAVVEEGDIHPKIVVVAEYAVGVLLKVLSYIELG